jgi:hypothetical protein
MKHAAKRSVEAAPGPNGRCCNHPLAVLLDPTEFELRELERMLAECPNCSRWAPGDGPIIAVLLSRHPTRREPEEIR